MKKTIIVLLLVVAAGIGATFWTGNQIEEQLPTFLQRVAQIGQFNIELTSYNRDIFRSTAVTTITFQGTKTEQVVLHHTIWHGPLPFSKTRDGQWHVSPSAAVIETTLPKDIAQQGTLGELLKLIPDFDKFHELTIISLNGDGISTASIPPFEQQFDNDGTKTNLTWGGFQGTNRFNADLSSIEGEASISRIKISDLSAEGEITGLTTTFRVHEDASGLLLGDVTIDSSMIAFSPRGLPAAYSIKEFQLRNAARLNGDLASYAIEIAADEIKNPVMTFAPAGFEIFFSHLDAKTILGVQRQLQNLQSEVVDLTENALIHQISEIYLKAIPELINKKPEITLNYLRAQTVDGEMWAKGKVILSNENNIKLDNLNDFEKLIQAKGEAQIDKTLLLALTQKTTGSSMRTAWHTGQLGDITEEELNEITRISSQQQLDNLLTKGILTADEKNYKVDFLYQNGQSTLNGQAISN